MKRYHLGNEYNKLIYSFQVPCTKSSGKFNKQTFFNELLLKILLRFNPFKNELVKQLFYALVNTGRFKRPPLRKCFGHKISIEVPEINNWQCNAKKR